MEMLEERSLLSLLSLLIISLIAVAVAVPLAQRKGKSLWVFGILSMIPGVGFYVLFYLVGITDKDVYERLSRIEAKLGVRP